MIQIALNKVFANFLYSWNQHCWNGLGVSYFAWDPAKKSKPLVLPRLTACVRPSIVSPQLQIGKKSRNEDLQKHGITTDDHIQYVLCKTAPHLIIKTERWSPRGAPCLRLLTGCLLLTGQRVSKMTTAWWVAWLGTEFIRWGATRAAIEWLRTRKEAHPQRAHKRERYI